MTGSASKSRATTRSSRRAQASVRGTAVRRPTLPDRAFALMRSVGRLTAVPLTDAWARRELRVVARDFDALPVTSRLLVEHLTAPRQAPTPATVATPELAPQH